jgi:taurine dioxygenase
MGKAGPFNFTINRLTGSIGAEIEGMHVRDVTPEIFGVLRQAFHDNCMLVFRKQFLNPDELIAFTKWWGDIYITPYAPKLEGYPAVLPLYNMGKTKTVTEVWHHDASFQAEPAAIGILAAQKLPSAGGDTMFANQYLAYETLSEGMQKTLLGLRALHKDGILAKAFGIDNSHMAPQSHPVVRTHPDTGRKCLYVNILYTIGFDGMTREESEPMLKYLYAHSTKPEFIYRHRWQAGDVVMWDQRCTQHYAVHDYGEEERALYRSTVAGSVPV